MHRELGLAVGNDLLHLFEERFAQSNGCQNPGNNSKYRQLRVDGVKDKIEYLALHWILCILFLHFITADLYSCMKTASCASDLHNV